MLLWCKSKLNRLPTSREKYNGCKQRTVLIQQSECAKVRVILEHKHFYIEVYMCVTLNSSKNAAVVNGIFEYLPPMIFEIICVLC